MNQSELIAEIAERTAHTKTSVKHIIEALAEITTEKLRSGESISIHGKRGNDNAVIINVLTATRRQSVTGKDV